MRLLWQTIGFTSLALGILGIFLPLLPTTPFLLLSAFAFERSSEKFHNWLVNHPRLGPPIRAWRQHGAIGKRSKYAALAAMACALGLAVLLHAPLWVILLQALVMIAVAVFILSRPAPPGQD